MPSNAIPSTIVPEGSSLIVRLYDTARAVKVHKSRLSELAHHCDDLLSIVREYSPRFDGAEVDIKADVIEKAIERVLIRISGWAKLNNAAAFLKQNEIQNGIEDCHRELAACTDRFMVALSMVKESESQEQELARQRDNQQLVDRIADLREEIKELEHGRAITLEALQRHEQLLQTGVVEIDGQGDVPPVPDYSGKVSRVSEDAVIEGSQLVFYAGELTEQAALGRIRDQSPDSQKSFKKWIESSLGLRHRNILNFFGHVTIDDVIYSVNPWMENGNLREYIRRNRKVDRVQLLSEAASGVEFLHEKNIIHGDLCDKNIMIDRDGKAIVCGFDLFKFSNPAAYRARWLAPERITSASVASPTAKADIWSFGLLCLEVFTGKDPYHAYPDIYVPVLLVKGTHPEHPGSAAVGLSPEMWNLMESCWQIVPEQRPSMSEIRSTIRVMLSPRGSAPTAILRTVYGQTDTHAPIRRETDSPSGFRHLPHQALPEFPGRGTPLSASSPLPTTHGGRQQIISSTDPNPSITSNSGYSSRRTSSSNWCNWCNVSKNDSKPSEKCSEANVDSLSLQSTSSTGESNLRRLYLFGLRRSQTLCIILPQSRKWESVTPVVLNLLEKATTDSEGLLRPATDGTVLAGNLEGFISRVISDIGDLSRDDHFRATFLTIYQLFATSERLFDILKRRFETSELNPVTVGSRYSILLFIESWLKKGFEDEELKYSSMIKEFVLALVVSESVSETMQAKAGEIAILLEDPDYVRLRQPKSCAPLRHEPAERPEGMTPADLADTLTAIARDWFKCITYWDYVNFTRQRSNVQRIEAFNINYDLTTLWVQTTILHPDSIDERMEMYEEWIYTAEACRDLNNFSSTSAIVVALMSPIVTALALTCESKAKQVLYALAKELTPTDGVYQSTLKSVATNDLIPWLDLHLSGLNLTFALSNPIVEVDGHPLIDFKQCSEVAEQIEALVRYSPRTPNTTRPDVLAYVEYSLESSNNDDARRAAEERSADLASEEETLLRLARTSEEDAVS